MAYSRTPQALFKMTYSLWWIIGNKEPFINDIFQQRLGGF